MKPVYMVKITDTATDNNTNFRGETHVHYIGKGGRVEPYPCIAWGWSQKRWAEKYISDDIAWNEHAEKDLGYPRFWNSEYEILKIVS